MERQMMGASCVLWLVILDGNSFFFFYKSSHCISRSYPINSTEGERKLCAILSFISSSMIGDSTLSKILI